MKKVLLVVLILFVSNYTSFKSFSAKREESSKEHKSLKIVSRKTIIYTEIENLKVTPENKAEMAASVSRRTARHILFD